MDQPGAPSLDTTHMDAAGIIAVVRDHGVAFRAAGDRIKANPNSKLIPALRDAICDNYAAILEELTAEALLLQDIYQTLRDPDTGEVLPNQMAFRAVTWRQDPSAPRVLHHSDQS
jgi:hypothetical protein